MKPIYISKSIYEYTSNDKLTFLYDIDSKFIAGNPGFVGGARYGSIEKNWDLCVPDLYKGPNLNVESTATFADITDARAIELEQLVQSSKKPLGVMWSGGIDSTVIIAACIRNFKNLDNLTVFMNNYSYYENAQFFHDVIKKYNFDVININDGTSDKHKHFIIGHGDPSFDDLNQKARYQEKYPLHDSILSSKDNIINFMTQYVERNRHSRSPPLSQEFAIQYFELIQQNIEQTSAPIETVNDWFYWVNFNFCWTGNQLQHYSKQAYNKNTKNFYTFNTNTFNWFNTHEYQTWSFSDIGKQEKYSTNLYNYVTMPAYRNKQFAKDYIYTVHKNEYLKYKTKCLSNYNYSWAGPGFIKNVVVFDDGTGINDNEPERLQKFIQDYCLV